MEVIEDTENWIRKKKGRKICGVKETGKCIIRRKWWDGIRLRVELYGDNSKFKILITG